MSGPNEVLTRLREATGVERTAFAKILNVEPDADRERNVVNLAAAYEKTASETDYRKILVAVAGEAASQADWKRVEIKDSAETAWIEEYVYRALAYVHRPDRAQLNSVEKAKLREQAEAALEGKTVTQDATLNALATLAGVGMGVAFGWWGMLALAGVAVAGKLWSGSLVTKVVPATLILIHARKRREAEEALRVEAAA